MDNRKALKVIGLLADGIDPLTGEEFTGDAILQQPDAIRALHAARNALEKVCKGEKRRGTLPENAGRPWLLPEDEKLKLLFYQGVDFLLISKQHRRTKGSIISRLEKLGLIGLDERVDTTNFSSRTSRTKTG